LVKAVTGRALLVVQVLKAAVGGRAALLVAQGNRYVLVLHTVAVAALMVVEVALRLIPIPMAVVEVLAQSVLSGPVAHVHSHLLAQVHLNFLD